MKRTKGWREKRPVRLLLCNTVLEKGVPPRNSTGRFHQPGGCYKWRERATSAVGHHPKPCSSSHNTHRNLPGSLSNTVFASAGLEGARAFLFLTSLQTAGPGTTLRKPLIHNSRFSIILATLSRERKLPTSEMDEKKIRRWRRLDGFLAVAQLPASL